jgi:DNA-binding NtrC family response regulator
MNITDNKDINILIVDDDSSLRNMLSIVLRKEGYSISNAEDGRNALNFLKKNNVDLIISDIKMPDISGIELLKKVKTINKELPFILITAFSSTNDAIEAMKLGADDYITKPFNLDELKIIINQTLHKKNIERENVELKIALTKQTTFEKIVGNSPQMLKIFELIKTISQTDSTVLISGESGTGKELIAHAIHNKSPRNNRSFISINCGAIPDNLLESELFGHEKGSFTDAFREKKGLFEIANKGTLFLDEIGEMPQQMQVKLLRAIQERKIRKVGGNNEIDIDVRIIASTNKDLKEAIETNEFRSDLFFRLNVISINVPSLKSRKEDIPALMSHFLNIYNIKFNKNILSFEKEVIDIFLNYSWPGNIRELENYIERAVALEQSSSISQNTLPTDLIYSIPEKSMISKSIEQILQEEDFDFTNYIDDISKSLIIKALEINNNKLKETATLLKLSYRSLRYMIEKYKIKS